MGCKPLDKALCCSVRTGSKVILILSIIGSFVAFLTFGIALAVYTYFVQLVVQSIQQQTEGPKEIRDYAQTVINLVLSWCLPFLRAGTGIWGVDFGLTIVALVGHIQRKHLLILPYLIVKMIRWGLTLLVIYGVSITLLVYKVDLPGGVMFATGTLTLVLDFYLWYIVLSEFMNLKKEHDEDQQRRPHDGAESYALQPK